MKLLLYQMRVCVSIMLVCRFIHGFIILNGELFAWPFGELHGKLSKWKYRIIDKANKVAQRGKKLIKKD